MSLRTNIRLIPSSQNNAMNKKYIYLSFILLFVATAAFVVLRYRYNLKNKLVAFYELKERRSEGAKTPEWTFVKERANKLIRRIRENPSDKKTALSLANLYIQEARVTGNYAYYDAAALKYINDVLQQDQDDFEALTLKALLQLSQHHFADALVTAEKARSSNPYSAFVHGLLVDGQVEMGDYKSAIDNLDKMVSIRPDIRSYSRISYLREIHGDYPGAIEAMQLAVDAGGIGDEPTAWARVQLGKLYENTGDLKAAAMHYTIALEERPAYPHAIAGLGHIAMANKEYAKAILLYQQADSLINDYSYKEQLAELYQLTGDDKKAKSLMAKVVAEMSEESKKAEEDENMGHYADRELAYAYLKMNEPKKALQHALAEYNRRPDNIDVNETLAWVYYKNNAAEKALPYISKALRTGSKNPTLVSRAALIYAKTNIKEKAKELIQNSLKANANIDPLLQQESAEVLAKL